MKRFAAILFSLLLVEVAACQKSAPPTPAPAPITVPPTTVPPPPSVSALTLGKEIGADKRVTVATETFGRKDTIYAAVETAGTGHTKLRALWSFVKGDKTGKVDETTIEFDSTGPVVNEFHVSKPSGWPKGSYKLEVFLDDSPTPAMTKTFTVS